MVQLLTTEGGFDMAGMLGKLSQLARSPKGRELTERAQRIARDPETRRKIANARKRVGKRRQGGE